MENKSGAITSEEIKSKDLNRYPCPNCGGNMSFDPETQTLHCPFCDTGTDIHSTTEGIHEYDFRSAEETSSIDWGSAKRIIHCQSCGGEIIMDSTEIAKSCPFCGSSYVVKHEEYSGIVPESVVPFKISQKRALKDFGEWIKSRFFAPRDLKLDYKLEKLKGVYIPSWTYDSDTFSYYTAEAGEYYYVTETHWENDDKGNSHMVTRQVRKIRWHNTSGNYSNFFDDVLVNASRQINENIMRKIQPYYLRDLVKYNAEYLSGFVAERYSIGLQDGWGIAKGIIDEEIRNKITLQINADEVRNLSVNTQYSNITYKHILLPLWISSYYYKNKIYRFMVNGQTGEVQGEAPVSAVKVAVLVIICLIAIIVLFELYSHFRH